MWTSFIGFMASGKTTLIRVMSAGTGLPGIDLDEEIAGMAGATIPEIFQAGGVTEFRQWEQKALAGLSGQRPLLLGTGGGCVETPGNTRLLRQRGVVIWLDAPWEVLRARIEHAGPERRPLVGHLGWEGIRRLYLRRQRLYAEAAHFRIPTDRTSVAVAARNAMLRSLLWRRQEGSET